MNEIDNADEKKRQLFESQKETLDILLAHKAISQADYNKSLNGLIKKMGIEK